MLYNVSIMVNLWGALTSRDVRLLKRAAALLKYTPLASALDFHAVLDEIWHTVQEELDFTIEANNIAEFKRLRGDLQDAYVYRIASATQHPYALFQYVRRDRKAFTLFSFAHGMRCWDLPMPRFRMRGLLPDAVYVCEDGRRMTGEALMNIGVEVSLKGDCDSRMDVWRMEPQD